MHIDDGLAKLIVQLEADGRSAHTIGQYRRHVRLLAAWCRDVRRSGDLGAISHEEREQTLNQLLVEMDGFDTSTGVIVMSATNRPEILDQALLRPGRFDRQILVDRPDKDGREAILKIHAREVSLDSSVDLGVIAGSTQGFAGADLANLVNEAALLAARARKDAVTMEELQESIERVMVGLEKKGRILTPEEKRIVAFHEHKPPQHYGF